MSTAIITGAGGLVGSEAAKFFCKKGFNVVGIDNDMRRYFFGEEASTAWAVKELSSAYRNFCNLNTDIRDPAAVSRVFSEYASDISLVIHAAAQPSHDWAAKEPFTDFGVNATGTLHVLEACRQHCPSAVFIFTSTNKVYGDTPNSLPLVEQETRWEIARDHRYYAEGIDESMSIDASTHSIFGASKAAADLLVQEYGRYFGMKTGIFRCGCMTGPMHSGAKLHGFLAYLVKCCVTGMEYEILGYKGKQVRDNIHSEDLINAFYQFSLAPRQGEVYNMGGSGFSNCSMMEAVAICEEITGKKMKTRYVDKNRIGDHIWWISDISKFKRHYPAFTLTRGIRNIIQDIFDCNKDRWVS
jgi:CDP-paratose 2-epimerase